MRKIELQDGKWVEIESGILDPLLGCITNPFTGTPSTAPQQWIQVSLGLLGGIGVGALLFKRKEKKLKQQVGWLIEKPATEQAAIKQNVAMQDFKKAVGLGQHTTFTV